MGLKGRAWQWGKASPGRAYGLAGLALLIVSLMIGVSVALRVGPVTASLLAPARVHAADTVSLNFRFVDTDTNARIDPDILSIDGQDFTYQVSNGQLTLPAEQKGYMVSIIKDGYEPMEEILIEPSTGITEFRLLASDWFGKADSAQGLGDKEGRLVGYVRDNASGAPLAGATVRLEGQKRQVTTDASGYFSLNYSILAEDQTDPAQIDLDDLSIRAEGYVQQTRQYVQLFGGTQITYLINLDALDPALGASSMAQTVDERWSRGGVASWPDAKTPNPPAVPQGTPDDLRSDDPALQTEPVIDNINKVAGVRAHNIRVGFGCPAPPNPACRTGCTSVQVQNLEDYTRHSLPAEWISSWSFNSLEAGGVAVRSYGASFIVSPIVPSRYDICTNTCCQAYSSSFNSRTDQAIRATELPPGGPGALYVVKGPVHGGTPFRAEYSSENNAAPPCRTDGKTGTCLSDAPCACTQAGRIGPCGTNGHGRGMCQYGSQRWGAGQPGSGGPKDRVWILEHYYPNNPGYSGQNIRLGHW